MLTKNDLQQIRTVVHEAIQEEAPKIVSQELTNAIDSQIKPVIREELSPIKKKLDKLHKDVHTFVDHFDNRLTKIEQDVKILKGN